ncbi:hypothetical protein FKP32DRAFT_1756138 [Trametes sanguinea]|nr:hypothetical protein FKP32DRAFT_1756138 [Trametes sanguinea]
MFSDKEVAALLWKLHQKQQLKLPEEKVQQLEEYLGSERIAYEVERDAELREADRSTKLFAAAALLMAGQCRLPLEGLDLETVTGLMRVVVDGLQERMPAVQLQAQQQQQHMQLASSPYGSTPAMSTSSLLVSGADIVMQEVANAPKASPQAYPKHDGMPSVLGNMSNISAAPTWPNWSS